MYIKVINKNKKISTIYNATAVTAGSYTFTDVTAAHTIHVMFAINTYTITATAGSNGSINPSGDTIVAAGSNITYIFTPNPGYVMFSCS